jgi:hypothetical protein
MKHAIMTKNVMPNYTVQLLYHGHFQVLAKYLRENSSSAQMISNASQLLGVSTLTLHIPIASNYIVLLISQHSTGVHQ